VVKYCPQPFKEPLLRLFRRRELIGDKPYSVNVELTNNCNLNCSYCPRPNLKFRVGSIDLSVLSKVVRESAEFADRRTTFTPVGLGEPLLYPQLAAALTEIKAMGRNSRVSIDTNGTLLDEAKSRILCTLLGSDDTLLISCNGGSRESYQRLNGVDMYERVVGNAEGFLGVRRELGSGPRLIIQILETQLTLDEIQPFRKYWEPKVGPRDSVFVRPFQHWGDRADRDDGSIDVRPIVNDERRYPCTSPWTVIAIDIDGNIYPCCKALGGGRDSSDILLGNIKSDSLKSIYAGDRIRALKKKHLRGKWGDFAECSDCTNWSCTANVWFKVGAEWM
jgi:radical SAM protein with 4Fe4S-binding SPASM domain